MRFLLRFILILATAYGLQLFLPFWAVALAAFVVGLALSQRRKKRGYGKVPPPAYAFWAGFLAVGLLWGIKAFMLDRGNESLLSPQIAELILGKPTGGGPLIMIGITALLGALLGGFGAMTGNLLGEAIKNR